MKIIAAVLIFYVVISSHIASAKPQIDCYDYFSTFCVQYYLDNRPVERFNNKCRILCGPGNSIGLPYDLYLVFSFFSSH
ncbi:hypothetical protein SLE2022_144930 [Rubroshorea leprosula]